MKILTSLGLVLSCVLSPMLLAVTDGADLSLHQIQVKGTHNSYHLQSAIAFHATHKYTHLSLGDQLEQRGIRAFELDVHQSVMGGDLAVYHIGLIDGKTSCSKFKDCLGELKAWSDRNPQHLTIFVWIEIKDDTGGPKFADFDQVDAEIREILGDRLLTPDRVQGDYDTLQNAVRTEGWPQVEDSRGKFVFMLDHDDRSKSFYLRNESLRGRVMFPRASEDSLNADWAVVAKTEPGAFHTAAMSRNFLISDNICMAGDDPSRCFIELEKATAAGTHLLMDDFEGSDRAQKNGDYFVHFYHGFHASCNRLTAPETCNSQDIDGF